MKNPWTPWRMSYILGDEPPAAGCIFDLAGDRSSGREELALCRDNYRAGLLNRFPYANGHLLVAPPRHPAGWPNWTIKRRTS